MKRWAITLAMGMVGGLLLVPVGAMVGNDRPRPVQHDLSPLPPWQRELLRGVEIHARFVSGDQLGCLDDLLPEPVFKPSGLKKDVYMLTRCQATSEESRKRLLSVDAEIATPSRFAGRKIALIPVHGSLLVQGSCYSLTKILSADAEWAKGKSGALRAMEPTLKIVTVHAK